MSYTLKDCTFSERGRTWATGLYSLGYAAALAIDWGMNNYKVVDGAGNTVRRIKQEEADRLSHNSNLQLLNFGG